MVAPNGSRFKYEGRPAPCGRCGRATWWNGWRAIKNEVVRDAGGAIVVRAGRRHRARCSSGDRSCGSWTVYGPEAYPHRVFQLSVVSSAVAAVALGGATLTESAAQHLATRRSVSRWIRWVGSLFEVGVLVGLCARLDPQVRRPPVAAATGALGTMARAGAILRLLDQVADLLRQRGALGSRPAPALAAVLAHQLSRFGAVARLTRRSPPLRVDLAWEPG